jgi:hypothetical protein
VRRGLLAAVALTAALVVAPATALAGPYQQVYETYSTTGGVSACQFSAATLEAALKDTPSYSLEYDADFTLAVQNAISARAGGACSRGSSSKLRGLKLQLTNYGNPAPPSGVTTANGAGVPLPLVLLALLALFGLLGTGVIAGGRALGFRPRWAAAADHALRETEYRLGDQWRPRPKPAPTRRPQLPPGREDGELGRRPPPRRLGR